MISIAPSAPLRTDVAISGAALDAAPTATFDRVTDIATPGVQDANSLAYELGWDHARYGVAPALPQAYDCAALRSGLIAGRASAGSRRRAATPGVELWLRLRLQTWCQGGTVEPVQVTPRYLEQLVASHCPITRLPLGGPVTHGAVIARVRQDAACAAGNLVMLSAKAAHAAAGISRAQALERARQLAAGNQEGLAGLSGEQWARAAALASFVEPLPHAQACEMPLLVLPPNRLRLFNPAQALQAFISRQLLAPGWSLRMSRVEALVPAKPARHALQTFFHALLPRVLEAGRNPAAHELRWAIEDAWRHPRVQQRWLGFARQLSAAQCEALVVRAHARRLGQGALLTLDDRAAVEGWNLEPAGPRDASRLRLAPARRRTAAAQHGRAAVALPAQVPRQAALPLQ
jgi:hypothetical protein